MTDTTPREQLAEAERQFEELKEKIESLKQQTRADDLVLAKKLIATHGFQSSDLKPELKTSRASTATKSATTKSSSKK